MSIINFYRSIIKSAKLKKISFRLSSSGDEKDLDNLIQLCYSDKYLNIFLKDSGIKPSTLKAIYHKLIMSGAGQFADGHYVAASSLVYAQTLVFILDHYLDGKFIVKDYDDYDSSLFVVNKLVMYFQNKETGEIIYN